MDLLEVFLFFRHSTPYVLSDGYRAPPTPPKDSINNQRPKLQLRISYSNRIEHSNRFSGRTRSSDHARPLREITSRYQYALCFGVICCVTKSVQTSPNFCE